MAVVFALILILVLLASWFLTLLGLPGNWLMVVATAIYAYFDARPVARRARLENGRGDSGPGRPGRDRRACGGRMGVSKTGGSRRGAVMALVGSIVGGILGVFIGVPIPLIGSVVAAVFFAGLGAMAGAILGEISVGQRLGTSWRVGKAAFWGRLAGSLGEMLLGAVMIVS